MTSGFDIVVVGLGYVGLPVAVAASQAGLKVAGIDLNGPVVTQLNAGTSHISDIPDAELAKSLTAGFQAFSDFTPVESAKSIIICVPTPLDEAGSPDLSAVLSVGDELQKRIQPGCLVVLESTTYPGTTEEVLCPLLEQSGMQAGTDFHLAFSPERIDPGNPTFGITNTPKLVGGLTPACGQVAADLYRSFVDEVVLTKGTREAEMAKLLENTYRHVNIALVNEMAVFCHELDIDLWDAIRAASTKPFGFQAFWPGPGVGGHCIPIDPNYLSFKVRSLGYPFRFVELAQEISDRMPAYVVSRSQTMLNEHAQAVNGANVVLLGVTYKANIADERESPSRPIAERFLRLGANLSYCDPYVSSWEVAGEQIQRVEFPGGLAGADIIVLLQAHDEFDNATIEALGVPVLDTRGSLRGPTVEAL